MPLETAHRFNFQYGGILANAPRSSGLYALYKGDELFFVDEADSIYGALLDHWDQRKGTEEVDMPTEFAFERCVSWRRNVRLAQLVFKCRPTHTARQELKARER